MFNWLKSLFKKKTVIKEVEVKGKSKFNGICDFCRKPIKSQLVNAFYCKYCDRWYCEKHRVAEDHKCAEPQKPDEYKKGPVESWRKEGVSVRGK